MEPMTALPSLEESVPDAERLLAPGNQSLTALASTDIRRSKSSVADQSEAVSRCKIARRQIAGTVRSTFSAIPQLAALTSRSLLGPTPLARRMRPSTAQEQEGGR